MDLRGKLEEIEKTFSEIEARMADPELSQNLQEMQTLGKRHSELAPVVEAFREYRGIAVMPTYHPSYLLQNPSKKRDVWEDIKKVMDVLGLPLQHA